MLSKSCQYGIRAAIFIVGQSEKDIRPSLADIADEIDSPKAYTAKILQKLVRHNIIKSIQGINGGFEIEKNRLDKIRLEEVILAIDGNSIYTECFMGLKNCSDYLPCPVHSQFKPIRDQLKKVLAGTTLLHASECLTDGLVFLRNA